MERTEMIVIVSFLFLAFLLAIGNELGLIR